MRSRQLVFFALVALSGLVGCGQAPTGDDSAISNGGGEWTLLPEQCEERSDVGADPLERVGEVFFDQQDAGFLCELLQVAVDPDRQLAYAVGQGGLLAFDVSDPTAPEFKGRYAGFGRFYHVAVGADETVYVTHRDAGLQVIDVSDVTAMTKVADHHGDLWEGLALYGDWLYVVTLSGELIPFDVSSPQDIEAGTPVEGLSSGRLIAVGDGVAYVADGTLGLVPVDLSDPSAPVILDAVESGSGAQDVVVGDGVVYLAIGGSGIEIFDTSSPLSPVSLGTMEMSASITGLAIDGERLWAVSHESVVLLDVSTPTAPTFVNAEETTQWSMQVAAADGSAFLAEWGYFSAYSATTESLAPHLELSRDEVYLSSEGASEIVRVQNLGGADLEISGARVWTGSSGQDESRVTEERVQVRVSDEVVASGAYADLEIRFDGGEDLRALLCLESNDPDGSRTFAVLTVGESGTGAALGNDATDFVLEDLDGTSHRLSEQLGHPVVLVYFATW